MDRSLRWSGRFGARGSAVRGAGRRASPSADVAPGAMAPGAHLPWGRSQVKYAMSASSPRKR